MHTLHFYHNHLPSHPLQPIHLMRPAFSSTFPLKLEQALQSFSLQNPHSPFGKGGRSNLAPEDPSHLHTTLVLPPSLTTVTGGTFRAERLRWVPLNPLHNHQLDFHLYRAIRLSFTFSVTTLVGNMLEIKRNWRRAEIRGCVQVSLTPH